MAVRASDVIHTRERWPANEPLQVWLRVPSWLSHVRVTATAVEPALGVAVADHTTRGMCGQFYEDRDRHDRHVMFAGSPTGAAGVEFELTVERLEESGPSWFTVKTMRCLWSGRYTIPIEVVEHAEQALPVVSSPELDDAVRASLLVWWTDPTPEEPAMALLGLEADMDAHPDLARVAVYADVELRRNGNAVVVSELAPDWREFEILGRIPDRPLYYPAAHLGSPELLPAPDAASFAGWTVVLRGKPGDVLTLWEADSWWSGELEIPLAELVARAR